MKRFGSDIQNAHHQGTVERDEPSAEVQCIGFGAVCIHILGKGIKKIPTNRSDELPNIKRLRTFVGNSQNCNPQH